MKVYIAINPKETGVKAIIKVFTSQVKAFQWKETQTELIELHKFNLKELI